MRLFATILGMYSPHAFDLIGGAVSFTSSIPKMDMSPSAT
jgi:hypothetical protein